MKLCAPYSSKDQQQSAREQREPAWRARGTPSSGFTALPASSKQLQASPDIAPTSYKERKYRKIRLQGNVAEKIHLKLTKTRNCYSCPLARDRRAIQSHPADFQPDAHSSSMLATSSNFFFTF